jgi:cellulose synthase/poly-beta-1,6-N-acetylglucosamine synthase-like glycosyltransferase
MLRVLFFVAQAAVLAHVIYHGVVALWGWRSPSAVAVGERRRRLRVVVPAHNEARVIGGVLSDLIDDPYDNRAVCVVADRCTDETAAIAAGHGAAVAERSEGASGKGAALAWYLEKHPLGADESLVIFDADNRLPENTLGRIADRLDAGAEAVQCYLDVENPSDSWLATASALSYWASNRMVQLARSALGWSVDLGGTGMALTAAAIDAAGGFGASLTEDQELGARLALAGVPVRWLHQVRIRDEKPTDVGTAVRQRARWMSGRRGVARRYLVPLWRRAIARRSMALFDQGVRLIQPGRALVALLSALLAVIAAITGSDLLFPWGVWAAAALIQFLEPIPFLLRDGVPTRYVVRYPLLAVLAALWAPIRVMSSFAGREWSHTPHGEE